MSPAAPLGGLSSAREALDGGLSPTELLELAAERNRRWDAGDEPLRAFLSTWEEGEEDPTATREEPPADPGPRGGTAFSLEGVPVGVKDNLCTLALPTTCASRMLEGYRSPYQATAVSRLEGAGARVFGKTNMDEFAMGSSTENSAFGPTRNPVALGRVPGGSSGGSASAVAAGIVPAALGSSTGGSVRQPASLCGVVGVKPTYGRVSRYGLVAFASSLDQVGVIAGSVEDAARVLEVISGRDPRDATSQERAPPRAGALDAHRLEDAAVGVPREYMGEGLDPEVRAVVERGLEAAADAGAEVREVSLPTTDHAIHCYYVLAPAEASSNLGRYDGVRYGHRVPEAADADEMFEGTRGEGFGPEVKRRIMLGTYVLSAGYYEAYYLRAQRVRAALARDFRRAFEEVDVLFAPTSPTPAFPLGERTEDPYEMYLADVYTVSANLAEIPAVSIPIGSVRGLPVGGQLMAPKWSEERMLGLARDLERALGYEHPVLGESS